MIELVALLVRCPHASPSPALPAALHIHCLDACLQATPLAAFATLAEPTPTLPHAPQAPEMGSITGSEADLRKLSNTDAAQILMQYGPKVGITLEEIQATTDR